MQKTLLLIATFTTLPVATAELQVGKVCPVSYQNNSLGILVFSREWYHSGRTDASYIPKDDATGVGLEIHFFANAKGHPKGQNHAFCDRYRMVQIRSTTARLGLGESTLQVDIPDGAIIPFYDNSPLEFGYGTHLTPKDDRDKPWQGQASRASTLAIYDTPFVSDAWGVEGKDIRVEFETCVVCGRTGQFDTILSCGHWGYKREFMGGMTGWAEPEFLGVQCNAKPSEVFKSTLDSSHRVDYSYWLNWR